MAFRILEYMILIWRSYLAMIPKSKQRRKWFKIPLIIPIVLASKFMTSEEEVEFYLQELGIEKLYELSSCYSSFEKIENLQEFVQNQK